MAVVVQHLGVDGDMDEIAQEEDGDLERAFQALGVEFHSLDEDDEDVAMNPQFDEFDAWERALQTSLPTGGKQQTVPELQKLFLDELNEASDANEAAVKALKRLLACKSVPQAQATNSLANASGTKSADVNVSTSWSKKQAVQDLKKLFEKELANGNGDPNKAAARALLMLRKSAESKTSTSISKKQAAQELKKLFQKELANGNDDPNKAAAMALLMLGKSK